MVWKIQIAANPRFFGLFEISVLPPPEYSDEVDWEFMMFKEGETYFHRFDFVYYVFHPGDGDFQLDERYVRIRDIRGGYSGIYYMPSIQYNLTDKIVATGDLVPINEEINKTWVAYLYHDRHFKWYYNQKPAHN